MLSLVWLVPTLPLLGVVVNGIFGRRTRARAHTLGVGTTGLSFLIAFGIFLQAAGGATLNWDVYVWIPVGEFQATVGFLVDPLSAVMMLVVTFVGLLIHIYSIGYMHGDPGYARFFTYMNLFMTSMLVLVLANNYLLMFLGWEGVGLCSYLLIGFWYQKKSAADAGKKAFVVNRIGTPGSCWACSWIWRTFGSVAYAEIFPQAEAIREILERDSVFRALPGDLDDNPALHRGHRKVRPASAVRLAAGRHGGPHAGLRPDPCRHHGDGGRVHGGPVERPVQLGPDQHEPRGHGGGADGRLRRQHRPGAE